MRQFVCECLNCGLKKTRQFKEEPYPEYGEVFVAHCKVCDSDQNHTRVLTRKTQAELRRRQEEEDLKRVYPTNVRGMGSPVDFCTSQ
mgnify:CR=1 FL=1